MSGLHAAQSKRPSAVINMDRVGMLRRVHSNSAENSVIDSTWINQPYRARLLPRVGFHAADRANMLNSAGSDLQKCGTVQVSMLAGANL